jgi:hypothetical protein
MVEFVTAVRLLANAAGALGGTLLFIEFFQFPSYVGYEEDFGEYNLDIAPADVTEHTWFGRVGALLVAVAFAAQFVVTLL